MVLVSISDPEAAVSHVISSALQLYHQIGTIGTDAINTHGSECIDCSWIIDSPCADRKAKRMGLRDRILRYIAPPGKPAIAARSLDGGKNRTIKFVCIEAGGPWRGARLCPI